MKKLCLLMIVGLVIPGIALADDHEEKKEAAEGAATTDTDTTPGAIRTEVEAAPPVGAAAGASAVPPKQTADAVESAGSAALMDMFTWQILASGYYMFNAHRVGGPYNAVGYPYSRNHGFGLNFVGGDIELMGEKGGMRVDLRWGNGADELTGIAPVKQGYVTYIPCDKLQLDLGFWDTVFGAEVVDEWQNINFTRGALYFNLQPFNHLGIRGIWEASDEITLTGIITNGGVFGGRANDLAQQADIQVPTFGAQVGWAPNDEWGVFFGFLAGPNGTDGNKDWEEFIDLVVSWSNGDWTAIFNGDIVLSPNGPTTGNQFEQLYGLSGAGQYQLNEHWAFGLRYEYLNGDGNSGASWLHTVTGTVRYIPVEFLVISLEPRAEFAEGTPFFSRPFGTDPSTGNSVATADQDWFFGFWIGATAHLGN